MHNYPARNLTITRTKSFVASMGKMKVYIEDPDASELLINGVPCRKLGTVKNGETVTFPIGYQAAKVFVIADKASRNFSNDYYPIPAGTEDVVISGKNHYNPGAGNPFRFDGVTDPEVLANRKKGGRKGILILVIALIVGFVMGLAGNMPKNAPKTFYSDAGISITLTEAFEEADFEGFTQCYDSNVAAVFVLEEEFSLMAGMEDWTLEEYAVMVAEANGMGEGDLKTEQGITYFAYTAAGESGELYYYCITIHKGPDAFWLVQFAAPANNQTKMHEQFLVWANSVEFE